MTQPKPTKQIRFRERVELLDFLLDVARVTAETLDLDKLLENVATIVKDVVPYDLFAILLWSERRQGLSIRYSIGHRDEVVRTLLIPLNEGITGTAAATGLPILVEDVRQDSRYLNALDAVRSELSVPMTTHGHLVGVIDLQSTRVKAYTEQDRSLIRLIGARVASSIENARLYRRIDRQNRTLRTLGHLSREFSSILNLDELLGKIANATRSLFAYDAFSVFLLDPGASVLRHHFSVRYDERVHLDNVPLGKGITGAAAESGLPVRVDDTAADPRYIDFHPGVRSELAVPLIVKDRVVGVLDVESRRMGYFTEDHQRTLSLLAAQIASSIENARLYEELTQREQRMDQDLKAARKLQHVLMPRSAPSIPGLEVGIRSRPAREVTGDVFDFFEQEQEKDYVLIAFGDVSGKGAAAALYGALVSGLLRILGPRRLHPGKLVKALNELLLERKVDAQYATLLVAQWEPVSRRMLMANAGAEPPMVLRRGEIIKPTIEGVPIGLLDDREYDEVSLPLEPGDVVLFYSDGVEDQLNAEGKDFARERVIRLLTKHAKDSPQAIADAFFTALDRFRGSTPLTDDQTLVVARVTK